MAINRMAQPRKSSLFLPKLCSAQALFFLVVGAELLAILLTLAEGGVAHFQFEHLAFTSLQTQWIAITSAFALCQLNTWLGQHKKPTAGSIAFVIILGCATGVNLSGQWLLSLTQVHSPSSEIISLVSLIDTLLITAIVAGITLRYLYLQQQLQVQREAELHARLQALQSRIHPHFLFNSMNSIASLIAIKPEQAESLVLDLASVFRASLAEPALISLEQEILTCKRYLAIESCRLGDRLILDWQIDSTLLNAKMPSLSLQPLIENAIIHGIEPQPVGGTLSINISQLKNNLRIIIRNPRSLAPAQSDAVELKNNGIALHNIRHRLASIYGSDARLTTSYDQTHFSTALIIPLTSVDIR